MCGGKKKGPLSLYSIASSGKRRSWQMPIPILPTSGPTLHLNNISLISMEFHTKINQLNLTSIDNCSLSSSRKIIRLLEFDVIKTVTIEQMHLHKIMFANLGSKHVHISTAPVAHTYLTFRCLANKSPLGAKMQHVLYTLGPLCSGMAPPIIVILS